MAIMINESIISNQVSGMITLALVIIVCAIAVIFMIKTEIRIRKKRKVFDATNKHFMCIKEMMSGSPESVDRVIASYKELIRLDEERYGGQEGQRILDCLYELNESRKNLPQGRWGD